MLFFKTEDTLSSAACRNISEQEKQQFFPLGRPSDRPKEICAQCPVKQQCLARALEFEAGMNDDLVVGVWGGLTSDERNALRRELGINSAA